MRGTCRGALDENAGPYRAPVHAKRGDAVAQIGRFAVPVLQRDISELIQKFLSATLGL